MEEKLQWAYPDGLSKDKYFAVMGGLHLEQHLLKINGQLVTGSGLDGIMDTAKLPYIGLKTAFCDVNDIKKALYAVEVVVICLYKQLSLTHSESETHLDLSETHLDLSETHLSETHLDLDTWAGMQEGVMFKYWYSVMRFQMTTLMLVQSFRESYLSFF